MVVVSSAKMVTAECLPFSAAKSSWDRRYNCKPTPKHVNRKAETEGVVPNSRKTELPPLQQRVHAALRRCATDTGRLPNSQVYDDWRKALPEEERRSLPSLTAVIPMAYQTWAAAREAAGLPSGLATRRPGTVPQRWDINACREWVLKWQASDTGTSLQAFTTWLDAQRAAGQDAPSVSTIRFRFNVPWSRIVATAQREPVTGGDSEP